METLQQRLRSIGSRKLQLLVSVFVRAIKYEIPDTVSEVKIVPCGATKANTLSIDAPSTYCGVPAWAWDQRPARLCANNRYSLSQDFGCYYAANSNIPKELHFRQLGTVSDEKGNAMADELADIQAEVLSGDPRSTAHGVSSGQASSQGPRADGSSTWLEKWKAVLCMAIGIGVGAGVAGGAIWFNCGGVFLRLGSNCTLIAGYFNAGAIGAAAETGGLTGITAAAALYYISWGAVWKYFKAVLRGIWDKVVKALRWIWGKMKRLGSALISAFGG